MPPAAAPPPPPPDFNGVFGVGLARPELPVASHFSEYLGTPIEPPCQLRHRRVFAVCFVRNEIDVVADWAHYHAGLFGGYANLHIVDNNSTDGTWQVLTTLSQQHGLPVSAREFSHSPAFAPSRRHSSTAGTDGDASAL